MRSEKERLDFALARTMSAEVIADVGKAQAANALLSEAQCIEIGDAWHRSAKIARRRRQRSQRELNKQFPTHNIAFLEGSAE